MITTLDMPDDDSQWPAWLESQLINLKLGNLVLEIEAAQRASGRKPTKVQALESVLGTQKQQVLNSGLSGLETKRLLYLMRHPRLLLQLQELVLEFGGAYWEKLARSPGLKRMVEEDWQRISQAIAIKDEPTNEINPISSRLEKAFEEPSTGPVMPQPIDRAPANQSDTEDRNQPRSQPISADSRSARPKASWLGWAVGLATTVIGFLMGTQYHNLFSPDEKPVVARLTRTWGWDRPEILATNLPRKEYLNHLANLANEWFVTVPANAVQLEIHLRELRNSCDTLIAAPHIQLNAEDREWLVEKCKIWSGKLDEQIAKLQKSEKIETDFESAKTDSDQIINGLIKALREKADI